MEDKRRTEIIELLRDVLDSLIVAVESGAGFDQAIYQYAIRSNNELARAFEDVLQQIQSGISRREALSDMARRIDVPELTFGVNAIIEADEKGASVLETLKRLAEQLRQI